MKNILITGSNGQLGSELKLVTGRHPENKYFFTDIPEMDITDTCHVEKYVADNNIDIIINCAAYTNVDKAESDIKTAELINTTGAESLAKAALKHNATLIHISTDYVFDGTSQTPYNENDSTSPLGVYGSTKLAGEQAIRRVGCSAIIIRTSWLYSKFGNNFVKTMLRLGSERESLNVVADQIGTPTNAKDLAEAIFKTLPQLKNNINDVELYHYSNEGVCSWYDFASSIMALSNTHCKVNPIPSSQYPTPTPRPAYSVLNKEKIKKTFGITIPTWEDSLKEYFLH